MDNLIFQFAIHGKIANVITRNGLHQSCGKWVSKEAYCKIYLSPSIINWTKPTAWPQMSRRVKVCSAEAVHRFQKASFLLFDPINHHIIDNSRSPQNSPFGWFICAPSQITSSPIRCHCPTGQLVPIAFHFPTDRSVGRRPHNSQVSRGQFQPWAR